jgi:hypothetical protein
MSRNSCCPNAIAIVEQSETLDREVSHRGLINKVKIQYSISTAAFAMNIELKRAAAVQML